MARVSGVARSEPTASVWDQIDAVLGHRPETLGALKNFVAIAMQSGTLSPRLLELVRLRIGFHNQCRTCMAVRYQPEDVLDEALVCSLERPHEAEDLTEAERCALRFADLLATNHLAIGDAVFEELKSHFSEAEIVELGLYAAYCVGFGRFFSALKVTEHLPESFRTPPDGESVVPWGHASVERADNWQ